MPYNIENNKSFMLNSVFLGAAVLFDLDLLDFWNGWILSHRQYDK